MINNSVLQIPLNDENGNQITLKDFENKKIVLYFYPKDNTPGCTIEAQNFRDLTPDFNKLNTVILGVSKDDIKSHQKFIAKYCLPFKLISDTEGKLIEAFGVWVEKSMYGKKYMGIERSTFVLGEKGETIRSWRKVNVKGHAQEVLDFIKSVQ